MKSNQTVVVITTHSAHSINGELHSWSEFEEIQEYQGFPVTNVIMLEDGIIIESYCNIGFQPSVLN